MAGKKTPREHHLKIPYHILSIPDSRPDEKLLPARIHSFGEKSRWRNNATLAKIFMTSTRMIKRRLVNSSAKQV